MPELLSDASNAYRSGHAGIEIEIDAPEGLPPVMADRQRIGQVLNNLLVSVARHVPDSSSVKLSASLIDIYVRNISIRRG